MCSRCLRDVAEHHALRVADAKGDGGHALAVHIEVHLRDLVGLSHRSAERIAAIPPIQQLERLHAGIGLDVDERALLEAPRRRNPGGEAAHAVAGDLRAAGVGVEELHRRALVAQLVDDQPVRANPTVSVADLAGEGQRISEPREVEGIDEEEVVAERVRFDQLHLRQNARRCHPKRFTSDRGRALKVPTNMVLNTKPFHPPWRRDLTGNRSSTISTSLNPSSRDLNSAALYLPSTGASSCSSGTFISFESALSHDTRLYTWKIASCPGFKHTAALGDQPLVVGGVLHDTMRVYEVERVVGERQLLAVRFAEIGIEFLVGEVLPRQRDGRRRQIDAGHDRAALGEADEIRAGAAPDLEHPLSPIPVELDEPKKVVQLFEVVLIEIGEEPRRSDRVRRYLEVMNMFVPVLPDVSGSGTVGLRHGALL